MNTQARSVTTSNHGHSSHAPGSVGLKNVLQSASSQTRNPGTHQREPNVFQASEHQDSVDIEDGGPGREQVECGREEVEDGEKQEKDRTRTNNAQTHIMDGMKME